jgi:hypothetical protein
MFTGVHFIQIPFYSNFIPVLVTLGLSWDLFWEWDLWLALEIRIPAAVP